MDSTEVSATSHRQSNAGSTTRAHMVCSTPPNAKPYDSDTVCQPRLHKTQPRQVCIATAQRSAAVVYSRRRRQALAVQRQRYMCPTGCQTDEALRHQHDLKRRRDCAAQPCDDAERAL